jgi:hypothetical protein
MSIPIALLALVIGSPPKLEALVAASRRGDPVELDRVARRLGAGRLLQALGGDRPAELRRAALEAAPRVEESWTLLVPSARLVGSRDAALAQAALRSTRRIAVQLASGLERVEVPDAARRHPILLVRTVAADLARAASGAPPPMLRQAGTPGSATPAPAASHP